MADARTGTRKGLGFLCASVLYSSCHPASIQTEKPKLGPSLDVTHRSLTSDCKRQSRLGPTPFQGLRIWCLACLGETLVAAGDLGEKLRCCARLESRKRKFLTISETKIISSFNVSRQTCRKQPYNAAMRWNLAKIRSGHSVALCQSWIDPSAAAFA